MSIFTDNQTRTIITAIILAPHLPQLSAAAPPDLGIRHDALVKNAQIIADDVIEKSKNLGKTDGGEG